MQVYKHILLAVDLNDEGGQVENKAAEIQMLTRARLSIIHVIEPLPMVYMGSEFGSMPDYIESNDALIEKAKGMLAPIAGRLKIPEENLITVTGSVSHEVLNYAKENDVDLIVVGSHGRHGLQLMLGSTANAVLHHAMCDVLSVRLSDS